ncbi:hypothetical protein EST62_13185 [Chlorobaculum sp. 24CR]|uniref:hypothetical protein n=1 Tax=Chlorobaculum sp. 24CR TaxID=2508878 RepID=UPI00100B5173|nr:hypothetical protein [Chlorobaculum sp. 24CR]RXK80050.1 hypothetical protein EST62_13185 [Chlorobaculum sp. 24CR]
MLNLLNLQLRHPFWQERGYFGRFNFQISLFVFLLQKETVKEYLFTILFSVRITTAIPQKPGTLHTNE